MLAKIKTKNPKKPKYITCIESNLGAKNSQNIKSKQAM